MLLSVRSAGDAAKSREAAQSASSGFRMTLCCESLVPPPYLRKLSLWLALASAVAILLSIGVSQILLAIALGVLLLSGLPLEWPRITWPLALFWVWTLIALAASPDPAFGVAQLSKVYVFLILLIVYS